MRSFRGGQVFVFLFFVFCSTGCDSYHYRSARFFEKTGRHLRAVKSYEALARRSPNDPRSGEALVRAAEIYSTRFKRCLEARRHYEAALRQFPTLEPWAGIAKAGLLGCPDYFPIDSSRLWVYGDSASRGRNMRLESELRVSRGGDHKEITSVLYAGKKRIKVDTRQYQKKDWAVWEVSGRRRVPILKYPFTPGTTWSAQSAEGPVVYQIESNSAEVRTQAGTFSDCLKVRELNKKFPRSWKYDYYAPDVGRVKTTVGGPGFENPNTELLQFGKIAVP